ncbi:UNKNOWN [Stylonychia lemnae]|uniref:Uncharacterized protein n=1 Tax=Stylonychia lemnae TaxID=5949 RepID=A0A078ALQ1_STYLE|nr:UNKNOWN [Stylonychia lemnae]|eukprot:CDW81778.1 UNKNOWN [Stylonychia lemnae]
MSQSNPTGDIISRETIILSKVDDQKEDIPEKGNLVELADNIADKISYGFGTISEKIHDLFLGSNNNIQTKEQSEKSTTETTSSSYHQTDEDLKFVTKFPKQNLYEGLENQNIKDMHLPMQNSLSMLSHLNPELQPILMDQKAFNKRHEHPYYDIEFKNLEQKYINEFDTQKQQLKVESLEKNDRRFPITFDQREFVHDTLFDKNQKSFSRLFKNSMDWKRRPTRKHESKELDKLVTQDLLEGNRIGQNSEQTATKSKDASKITKDLKGLDQNLVEQQEKITIKEDEIKYEVKFKKIPFKGRKSKKGSKRHPSHWSTDQQISALDEELKVEDWQDRSFPQLGISLRQGLEQRKIESKVLQFNELREEVKLNQEKPEEPAKPSNFVGMYQ